MKIKFYKTVLRPVVLFGSEKWALTSKHRNRNLGKKKSMLGEIKENGEKNKTNKELAELVANPGTKCTLKNTQMARASKKKEPRYPDYLLR